MGIEIKSNTDFSKLRRYLENVYHIIDRTDFDKYGREGVEALRQNTPVDSGKTASSWIYRVKKTDNRVTISWSNTNINEGCSIAIILQYGHATGNGTWIEGRDYINPAVRPIFKEIEQKIRQEVRI
jgi:hypothetical protein